MTFDYKKILRIIKGLLVMAVPEPTIHSTAERAFTFIPKADRMKLYAGLSAAQIETAEASFRAGADAFSDWAVFVATEGDIEPD